MKNRIFYFDELRALAILLVILIHVSKWFAEVEPIHSFFWCVTTAFCSLGNMGVPLFLMISGALLLNRKHEFKSFFKRRFSRIFIPFCFWIVFIMLFKVLVMDHGYGIEDIISMIFYEGFVWFIWALFGIYLFYPIINSYVREYSIRGCEYYLIIWFATLALYTIKCFPIKNVELGYFAGFLGFFVWGYYLSNKEFKLNDKTMIMVGLLIFLISFLGYNYCFYYQIDLQNNYLTIFPMLEATGVYLMVKYVADYSENHNNESILTRFYYYLKDSWIGKIIVSISVCSYGIYFTHYFPIWIVQKIDMVTPIFLRNPFKWVPFLFLISIGFSWGLIYILSRTPYLKKVCGV